MLKTKGGVIHANATERELMAAIDATIAATENCRTCGASVHVETTQPGTPYVAWLVCNSRGCGRKTMME